MRARIIGVAITALVGLTIAAAQTPAPVVTGTSDILSPVAKADQPFFSEYIKDVIFKAERNWYDHIPKQARGRHGERGKLTIQFVIHRNGKISDMILAQSSGDVQLDQAAWNALLKTSPYKRFPKQVVESEIKLRFLFLYNEQPGN